MNQNDLNNTQVLNMDDVEEIAKYEKAKSRRPAIMLAVAGVLAIVMGIVQPIIMNTINGPEASGNVDSEKTDDNNNAGEAVVDNNEAGAQALSCTYAALASADGVDTSMTISFNFADSKLQNFTKNIAVVPTVGNEVLGTTTINTLLATYQGIAATQPAGYVLVASVDGTSLSGNLNVDFSTLDKTTLSTDVAANILTSVNYDKDATFDDVKAAALAEGYTCE